MLRKTPVALALSVAWGLALPTELEFDGLTYSEIAGRLAISVATVRKYMLKAGAR